MSENEKNSRDGEPILPEQQNRNVSQKAVLPGGGESPAQRVAPTAPPKKPRKKAIYKNGNTAEQLRKKRQAHADKMLGGPIEYLTKEVVVDKNGVPRQAGTSCQEGEFIVKLRQKAEDSLYFFCKGVLNRHFLTPTLHKPVCEFQQRTPPFHKLTLMPREHAKTAIISGGLPLHILIQPAVTNCYFPGIEGSECRILLAGETQDLAEKNLRVLEAVHSTNKLFRILWPHRVWDNAKRQSKVWNAKALIFPRENEWPDPTIWAKGTDGAVTGSRPNVMIKDDLISLEASRSPTVMGNAIEWHRASRALLDSYEKESGLFGLEFIIGTRWSVYDLYSDIIDNDPSVEVINERFHQISRKGKILWPEKHTKETIRWLMDYHKDNGMFYLLYMNNAADPSLVDFDLDAVRDFQFVKNHILFDRNPEIDDALELMVEKLAGFSEEDLVRRSKTIPETRGRKFTPELLKEVSIRTEYLRAKRY